MQQMSISEENKVRQNKSHPAAQNDVIQYSQPIFRGSGQLSFPTWSTDINNGLNEALFIICRCFSLGCVVTGLCHCWDLIGVLKAPAVLVVWAAQEVQAEEVLMCICRWLWAGGGSQGVLLDRFSIDLFSSTSLFLLPVSPQLPCGASDSFCPVSAVLWALYSQMSTEDNHWANKPGDGIKSYRLWIRYILLVFVR